MEVSVRELKARLSQYLRNLEAGGEITVTSHGKPVGRLLPPRARRAKRNSPEDEAIENLRSQSWIRAGTPGKPRVPTPIALIEPGQQTPSDIVNEQRGER